MYAIRSYYVSVVLMIFIIEVWLIMEKPALQYERTLLSWWRTILSTVIVVAAISRIGMRSSNQWMVMTGFILLFFSIFFSLFQTIELSRNIKGNKSIVYGPYDIPKKWLSLVLVTAALFYALSILFRIYIIFLSILNSWYCR